MFVIVKNMGLQRYLNTYMLILLLSAITVINVKAASRENDTNVTTDNNVIHNTIAASTDDDDVKSDSSSSNDDDNKNKSSVHTDDDNDTNNKSTNNDNDNGKNDTNVNPDDNNEKNDTNVTPGNNNGKNDTNNDDDTRYLIYDIRIISACLMKTKIIGNLLLNINQLSQIVFVFIPSLRSPYFNFFENLYVFIFNLLVNINWLLQSILKRFMPIAQIGMMLTKL
ncbi:uncharacterized protein [Anoplolepis gracilipes]|uniref:uncharacterized protein n=1 Tax=Anoplolepis gracilipes TaxID=354296 RepID=UPI003B9F40C3